MSERTTPILQFGTSRFLQAHADLFFGEAVRPLAITVVQSSGDPSRTHRLRALADPSGYPVRIRGLMDGQVIDETRRVTSVRRALSTHADWSEVERVFREEATIVLSNTGDTGYEARERDGDRRPHPDMSYPAKLFHLLADRFARNPVPLQIMPLELINDNGAVLKRRVLDIAHSVDATRELVDWIDGLSFADSLVDRIVSEPLEPAGAVAEPYALWAIGAADGVVVPCEHPAVHLVPDLETIERLKLHILNLGHSVLAHHWIVRQLPESVRVRDLMAAPDSRAQLDRVYSDEVLKGFAAMGMGEEASRYHRTTLERLCNPFLDHRVADIAQNHAQKVDRRIDAYLRWVSGTGLDMPMLTAIRRGVLS